MVGPLLKTFFSESTLQFLTKHGMNSPWIVLVLNHSQKGPSSIQDGHCYKNMNFLNGPKQLYLKPESAKCLTVGTL